MLWTDATEHKYIEESGMMNVMFVIGDKLITPSLSDSILDGVTRDCLLTLASDMGFAVEERPVAVSELERAFANGTINSAFGAGTAAVVAPISVIHISGTNHELPAYTHDNLMFVLKEKLDGIRYGECRDQYNWNCIV